MTPTPADQVTLRSGLRPADRRAIARLVRTARNFRDREVAIAIELVDERLARGPASGYRFLLAEAGEQLVGYACYGPIPCTDRSYDLYWIVVSPAFQGRGLGHRLLAAVEAAVREARGRLVYVETSSRPDYERARCLYTRAGYALVARLTDFYAPNDDKMVYAKWLRPPVAAEPVPASASLAIAPEPAKGRAAASPGAAAPHSVPAYARPT